MSDVGILIPLAGIGVGALAVWTRHQARMARLKFTETAERSALYANSNRELEERIRVLERIVTDGGYDTAIQIEALRDARHAEDGRSVTAPREKEPR